MIHFEWHIPVTTAENSIISLLTDHGLKTNASLSINEIKSAIQKGALWLTRGNKTERIRKIKKPLNAKDKLHFYYDSKVLSQQPTPAILVSDQQDYSIWYKPYGMLCQGSKWSDHCTISRWVESHLEPQRPAFIVHRLDRAASGLIIIAHNKKANKAFSQLFEQRNLDKRYHVIVHGQLNPSYLANGQQVTTPIDGKPALSIFYQKEYDEKSDLSLQEVKIATGRKHQIRKHAASIDLPVVGDRFHGDKSKNYQGIDLQLCAISLSFDCPLTQQRQEFLLPESLRPALSNIAAKISASKCETK
ncbi:pseudouridine synthase [Thalassotalea insulae]|uniref:Pseudouridine synthase n=1 Tax=Thalassotalea insulae TaxID=2056778 RepID=A0ABQ6GMA5_9GAMM|nr:RNA pseudouridine synthase [Thalassotalea insulae]GLX77052.1 pseudouridine synthase [Thalassotalea insulae]